MVTVHPVPQYTEILNYHLTYIGGDMNIMSLLCGRVVYVPVLSSWCVQRCVGYDNI